MARPKKDNAEYFPHDAGMRNDDRIKALRKKFKLSGYAIWNMLIEYLAARDHYQFEYNEFTLELLAGDFDADVKDIQDVISYCITLGLLQRIDGFIRCKTLENRLEPLLSKRERDRIRVIASENPQSKVKESKVKERKGDHTKVADALCEIFGKSYIPDPQDRLPITSNWFKTIDHQAQLILQQWPEDVAIKQIKAYLKHCKTTNRKLIGTDYKVAETILQSNWIALTGQESLPRGDPYEEARYNKTLWTEAAWREFYKKKIKTDPAFRKEFQITSV